MVIINGTTPGHLDMIDNEVVKRLLDNKWKAFGRKKLFERLGILAIHLLFICLAAYVNCDAKVVLPDNEQCNYWMRGVAIIGYIGTECGAAFFILAQQGSDIKSQGFVGYFQNLKETPAKLIFMLSNFCILLGVPVTFIPNIPSDVFPLLFALSLPGIWSYLLYFARSMLLTGPFVQMIYRMIGGDMIRFAIISLIFLLTFSQAFYFVGKYETGKAETETCVYNQTPNYYSLTESGMTLFRAAMGGYDYEELGCLDFQLFAKMLFVIYMLLMPVMLINMLIAMMGNTYTTVISQAEKAWRRQWAEILIALERTLRPEKLIKIRLEYSINMNESSTGVEETRGLMVVKQIKRSRAQQRSRVGALWKVLSRQILEITQVGGFANAQGALHSCLRRGSLAEPTPRRTPTNLSPDRSTNRPLPTSPIVIIHGPSRTQSESERPTTPNLEKGLVRAETIVRFANKPNASSPDVHHVQKPRPPSTPVEMKFRRKRTSESGQS